MAIERILAKFHKKKVGLALGSGAARGMAHIGVLNVLEKNLIPIDLIAGTSAGAGVGALYAALLNAAYVKDIALEMSVARWALLLDPAIPGSGVLRGKRIIDLFKKHLGGNINFSDLKMPFACVAADLTTGREVVFREGSVLEALRASISLPAIFTPMKWRGRYLVDGAIVNPVPVSLARRMGAEFIIAVNVQHDIPEPTQEIDQVKIKAPTLFQVVMQSIYAASNCLIKTSLEGADVVIEPRVRHIGYGEFHRAHQTIALGELAAENALPEIKRKLGM